jgi:hypothetical protein
VIFTHAIAPVLKREKIRAGRRMTFGRGFAITFVVLLPANKSWASTVLGRGGRDHGIMAASNIP